jgi:hypothetical protein
MHHFLNTVIARVTPALVNYYVPKVLGWFYERFFGRLPRMTKRARSRKRGKTNARNRK